MTEVQYRPANWLQFVVVHGSEISFKFKFIYVHPHPQIRYVLSEQPNTINTMDGVFKRRYI